MASKFKLMVDNKTYNVILPSGGVTRSFSILDGDNSGRVQTGDMIRDIIGTYYNYKLEVEQDPNYPTDYDALYEVVSAPQDYHVIVVPYGQDLYQFDAYVTDGEDSLNFIDVNGLNYWSGLSLNFVAMKPKRIPIKKEG